MNKRPYKKRYSSRRNSSKKNSESSSALGNQISGAIILCVFILIIAYTNSSITNNMHTKITAMISRNVVDDFEDKGNLKENLVSIVKTVFSKEDKDIEALKSRTEPIITNTGDEDESPPESSSTDDGESSQCAPQT